MNRQTFVYFIATADRTMVKIGCSGTPPNRLDALAAWSPVPLEILAAVPGKPMDERAIHSRYIDLHSHKEWFRSSGEMLADIEAIARFGELPSAFRGNDETPNPLAAKGIRATPEWRAKVSVAHKARWVRTKREREFARKVQAFLLRTGLTCAELKGRTGCDAFGRRGDGSVYAYDSRWHEFEQVELFMAAYIAAAPQQGEAA